MAVNDDAFKNTKKEYEDVRRIISIIAGFTITLGHNDRSGETPLTKMYESEELLIIPSETDVPKMKINTNVDKNNIDLSPNIEK